MKRSRSTRVDAIHGEVVRALRRLGWQVIDTHELPNFVDVVAMRHGALRLVEIKTDAGPLTRSQAKLIADGWPVRIVRSIDDAIALR